MATLFQKIFLSKKKQAIIERNAEIMKLISNGRIINEPFVRNDLIVRRFRLDSQEYDIYAEYSYDYKSQADEKDKTLYLLHVRVPGGISVVTNSHCEKIAEHAYNKMKKAWEKSRQNVK
ncbi:MAG: hypothetical protein IJ866_00390 [Alphaproteobacteria bacterium]|nr:hypothetical protein [Alphaproteobacteria bacterium]